MKRLDQMDSLRFIFTIIVVISHFEFLCDSIIFGNIYQTYFHNATMAVDYFFLLSGFGIYYSHKINNTGIRFAINKIKKLYVAYVVSLLLGLVYECHYYTKAKLIFKFILNLSLLQSLTGQMRFSHAINGVCWFLSSLFICYIFCPMGVKIVDKINSKKVCVLYYTVLIINILILSAFFMWIECVSSCDDLFYGHPIIRYLYVILGMMIGKYIKEYSNKNNKKIEEFIVIILSIVFFVFRNKLSLLVNIIFIRFIDIILVSILVYVFAKGTGSITKFLKNDKLALLGRNSMYIYLFHYPIRMELDFLFTEHHIFEQLGEVAYVIIILAIVFLTLIVMKLFLFSKSLFNLFGEKQ